MTVPSLDNPAVVTDPRPAAIDETLIDPSRVPGALQEVKTRDLPDGARITFEYAPYGWLTKDGEPRRQDYRAYYHTPQPECPECHGSGRAPSEKRPRSTIKCKPCNGTGECRRERMVSVTTLLDSISPKPGIPPWSEARGIEGAVEAVRRGLILPDTDPAEAVRIVRAHKLGADRARDDAAGRGLNAHALLEDYMRTGRVPNPADHPPEHRGYLKGLFAFLLRNEPTPASVEELVCDPAAGYAGRRDLVAIVKDGRRVGFDAKTQENGGICSSAHLQLGLYERAAVACGDEPCDELVVVVFAANGEFREMACAATPQTIDAALAFYEAIRPVDGLCAAANRVEKEARRIVGVVS